MSGIPALPGSEADKENLATAALGKSLSFSARLGRKESDGGQLRYAYGRPTFLQLNADEVQVSADHGSRPILVPRDVTRIPWNSGYAE